MTQLAAHLISENIRRAEFARRIGTSKGYLSDIANGNRTPSLELALRIERVTSGAVPVAAWAKSENAA